MGIIWPYISHTHSSVIVFRFTQRYSFSCHTVNMHYVYLKKKQYVVSFVKKGKLIKIYEKFIGYGITIKAVNSLYTVRIFYLFRGDYWFIGLLI